MRTPRHVSGWVSMVVALLVATVCLSPDALAVGTTYPTLLSPRSGQPFPQSTISANATCPVSRQCNVLGSSGGAVSVKLAASPSDGDIEAFVDADGAANVHAITVLGNGHTIDGGSSVQIGYSGGALVAMYSSTAGGWVSLEFQRKIDSSPPVVLNADTRSQSVIGPVTLAGDVTGPSGANTAVRLNGTSVGAGGALATGSVLRATGLATAQWGAVDLASSSAVSGTLLAGHGGTGLASPGATGNVLVSNGSAWTSGTVPIAPSSAIAALDVDWSLATIYTKTLAPGANAFTFSNATDGEAITLVVTGAASTLSWPVAAKWAGGTAPTQTASGTDVYTCLKAITSIYCSAVQALQ